MSQGHGSAGAGDSYGTHEGQSNDTSRCQYGQWLMIAPWTDFVPWMVLMLWGVFIRACFMRAYSQ